MNINLHIKRKHAIVRFRICLICKKRLGKKKFKHLLNGKVCHIICYMSQSL